MRRFLVALIVILTVAMIALICAVLVSFLAGALAEGCETMDCWVLCQPEDYINIRSGPGKNREVVGYAVSGMKFRTDLQEKAGFIHLVEFGETGEGWISSGYVVFSEPEDADREMRIRSNGRVACRKAIGGKRRCWARNGETVTVYRMTRSVAVTNKGYIDRKYLEELP